MPFTTLRSYGLRLTLNHESHTVLATSHVKIKLWSEGVYVINQCLHHKLHPTIEPQSYRVTMVTQTSLGIFGCI